MKIEERKNDFVLINLFGAPGSGKSTILPLIFAYLKINELNVEIAPEVCKGLVYDERYNRIAEYDPFALGGMQSIEFTRFLGKGVDVVVTDGSLFTYAYWSNYHGRKKLFELEMEEARSYNNRVLFLERGDFAYQQLGRVETEEESIQAGTGMKKMLEEHKIDCFAIVNKRMQEGSTELAPQIKIWLDEIICEIRKMKEESTVVEQQKVLKRKKREPIIK